MTTSIAGHRTATGSACDCKVMVQGWNFQTGTYSVCATVVAPCIRGRRGWGGTTSNRSLSSVWCWDAVQQNTRLSSNLCSSTLPTDARELVMDFVSSQSVNQDVRSTGGKLYGGRQWISGWSMQSSMMTQRTSMSERWWRCHFFWQSTSP